MLPQLLKHLFILPASEIYECDALDGVPPDTLRGGVVGQPRCLGQSCAAEPGGGPAGTNMPGVLR